MGHTACTESQCLYKGALYLYLYLYTPYVPYGLYRASVPVQWCTLPLPKPLLPLCAIWSVQSLSACTMVHFTFTYTSTHPMCRTAYTEPQCLENSALCLYLYLYSPYVPYDLYRASVPVYKGALYLYFTSWVRNSRKLAFALRSTSCIPVPVFALNIHSSNINQQS